MVPSGVDDKSLGEFCGGKQIQLTLPESVHPEYKGRWIVRVDRLIGPFKNAHALRCVYTGYTGSREDLKPADLKTIEQDPPLWIDIPVSSLQKSADGAKTWDRSICARELLKLNYPTATILADFAAMSTTLSQGRYPKPPLASSLDGNDDGPPPLTGPPESDDEDEDKDDKALRDHEIRDDDVDKDLPRAAAVKRMPCKVILPSRVVGGTIRSTKATWKRSKSAIIPDRQTRTSTLRPRTRSQSGREAKVFASKGLVIIPTSDGRVGFEPLNIKQARDHETWPLWKGAMVKEKTGLEERGTFSRVTIDDVPKGVKIMGSQYVYKDKRVTGAKARIVVHNDQQWPKPDSADTFSATPSPTEVRTLISLAVQNNYALHSIDISQAFVQADALPEDAHLYIHPPQGSDEPPGTVWKLHRPLYGLAVAPRAWSETLKRFLIEYGFKPVNFSDASFTWSNSSNTSHMSLVYHVDDILISFSNDEDGEEFKRAILKRFSGTDEGSIKRYLGIDFSRNNEKLFMSQEVYARDILSRFEMNDCNPCSTPLDAGYTISKTECPAVPDPVRRLRFQEITGALQYLVQWTRPDLAFATNELAKVNSNPSEGNLKVAYRVLRYLKGSAHLGLTYTRNQEHPNRLIAFADADFAACSDTRRSISSYITMMKGGAVSWKSRQQKAVATSTSQAEFVSAAWAADEILWLRRTLRDMQCPQTQPTPLWEDNRACRMMSENPVHKERSKHIDYRVHALRERVADGVVRLLDCPTVDMTADMGTKSLPAPALQKPHRDTALGLLKPTTPPIPKDLSVRGGGSAPPGPAA